MTMFYSEYRYSTWQDKFKAYGPFVIIGFMLLSILGFMGFLFSTGSASSLPASNMPAINGMINATKANAPNGIGNTILNTVGLGNAKNNKGGVGNAILNTVGLGNAKNNKGVMANLGNMLTTPKNV